MMPHAFDVAALGNAIVDVIASTGDDFLLKHNIAKGVMTLIDEHRARQLYELLPEGRESAGGSAANTLAGVASFGGQGLFVGKVKDDRLGESFAASMAQTNIRYTTPKAVDGPATACCLIAVTADGQRSMSTYLGASRELAPDDIVPDDIAKAQVLYIEGYLWDQPHAKKAITRAIEAAKKAGRKVALTLSDPFCVGRYRDEFLALWKNDLDILFANEEEVKALFEVDLFDDALQAVRSWNGIAALTRSAKGCVIAKGAEVHVLDAVPIARVADTTGAGDQFAAGFLYGLTHGKSLEVSGRLATAAAAEVISHYGARPETALATVAERAGLS
jgi:sugar/nucleoside kinase (ribokinase family)